MTQLKTSQRRRALKSSAATLVLAMMAVPAFAQTATTAAAAEDDNVEAIVVTGSRITNPNLTLSTPVGVITSDELALRQTNTAEQFLRELPSAVPSVGSAVNNGNGGASFVNLRGVGSQRNLVLLDGRRVAPADSTGRVDLNNVPLAIIERTDILTGGASTTYGADAVSGVINFITKRDFAGFDAVISDTLTERGDGNIFRADVTIGANFDDGRGNAVLSVGYQKADPVFQGNRPFSNINIDSTTGRGGGSSAAVPAFIIGPGVSGQLNETATDVGPFNRPYNFNPPNIFQTPFQRFNIYAAANYQLTDAVEVFTRGMFSKNKVATIIAPGGSFFNTYQINLNSPFIPEAVAQRFGTGLGLTAEQYLASRNTPFGATLADGSANPDYRQFGAQVRRRTVEAGTRDSNFTTTYFDYLVGARGGITDSIRWEVSASYGESDRQQSQTGFARFSRLQQGLLNLPDGSCVDSSNDCVPINLFGLAGSLTPEMVAYHFSAEQSVIDRSSMAQVQGIINGDFGFGFGSASPISFAVGAEYRDFSAARRSDDASKTPGEVVGGGGAAPDINGGYNVTDVFGEVAVPLLENVPFADTLLIEGGLRYSDYSTAGTNLTWKVGGTWNPVAGVGFRGNYQRSARAPNIGELFVPVTTGLDNLTTDPCQGAAPVGNAALAAVCIAQGAPAAIVNAGGILAPAAGQINTTGGGNPNLGVEVAKTWTVGLVIAPPSIPGFSMTIDYFNIKVEDAVSAPAIGDIIDGCYNSGNLSFADNSLCQLVQRNPFTGGLDGAPNETPGLLLAASNLGTIQTDGLDLSVRYSTKISDAVRLNLSFDGTWTSRNQFQAFPGALNRDCVGYYSVNCGSIQPEYAFTQRTSLMFGDLTTSLLWRFMSAVEYEPVQLVGDLAAGVPPLEEFRRIPAESYFDFAVRYNVTDNVELNFLVANLLDNKPTLVGANVGSTAFNSGNVFPSSYDALGRRYTASVRFRF